MEIVGAGMAAATEWLNALDAGASVISVRRRESERGARSTSAGALQQARLGRLPQDAPGRAGRRPGAVRRAVLSGRQQLGRAGRGRPAVRSHVAAELNGAPQVVCVTGPERGFRHDPLLARLVTEHALETAGEWIVLTPDSTVASLTDETRTLALAGVPRRAFPAADTLGGQVRGAPLHERWLHGVHAEEGARVPAGAVLAPLLVARASRSP